jgi:hypothetical protein
VCCPARRTIVAAGFVCAPAASGTVRISGREVWVYRIFEASNSSSPRIQGFPQNIRALAASLRNDRRYAFSKVEESARLNCSRKRRTFCAETTDVGRSCLFEARRWRFVFSKNANSSLWSSVAVERARHSIRGVNIGSAAPSGWKIGKVLGKRS